MPSKLCRHRAARAAAALKAGSRESRRVRRSAAEKELCNKTIIIPYEISDTIPVTRSLGRSAAGEGRTIRGRSGSGASLGHDPAAGSAGATLCTVAVWYGVTPVGMLAPILAARAARAPMWGLMDLKSEVRERAGVAQLYGPLLPALLDLQHPCRLLPWPAEARVAARSSPPRLAVRECRPQFGN